MVQQEHKDRLLTLIQDALDDAKALDVLVLDTANKSSLFSYIVICSCTSNRHSKAIGNQLIEALKLQQMPILGFEGLENGEWVLVDAGDVVVHIMLAQVRDIYQLEELWQ